MKKLQKLLTKTAEVHHTVWEYQDGNDSDWALWYATWLIEHSNFQELVEEETTISELTYLLFLCDKEFKLKETTNPSWQEYYANKISEYYKNKDNESSTK